MAKELATRGITANTIAPGAIETDFLGGAVRDTPAYNEAFAKMIALGASVRQTISGWRWRVCLVPTIAGHGHSAHRGVGRSEHLS